MDPEPLDHLCNDIWLSQQFVDDRVGRQDGCPQATKRGKCFRLARRDGTGQADEWNYWRVF